MAEISVPAWPMPIHQTKLMMAKRPADRDVVAPDADALEQQVAEREQQAATAGRGRSGSRRPSRTACASTAESARPLSVTVSKSCARPDHRVVENRCGRPGVTGLRHLSARSRSSRRGPAACRAHGRIRRQRRVRVAHRAPGRWCAAGCSARPAARSCAGSPCSLATRLFGSLRLPKVIACVGQAGWQAVTISPSRIARSSRLACDARRVDALHAVGALLHHAAAAHRDVRVALQLQRLGVSQS